MKARVERLRIDEELALASRTVQADMMSEVKRNLMKNQERMKESYESKAEM